MSISGTRRATPIATGIQITDEDLIVTLADGRVVSAPLEWFPRLLAASPEARKGWRFIGGGIGMHWEALDEDISVEGLLAA